MFAPPVAKTKAKTTLATAPSHAPKTGQHITQPKRVLGDVDDLLAQEAARASGQVVRNHIPARPAGSLAERATLLQRTIGNQATLRLLAQRSARPSGTGPDDQYEQAGRTMRFQ